MSLIIPADVQVPPINPNFSAPWMSGLELLASYLLGTALVVVLIMLVIAIAAIAGRTLGPERMRTWAGENIVGIFIAAAALGSASGLFQWFVGFNFGF
ncbi:hypothetical protein [Microbacterium rhizosphaerae]|uniref:Uncharacterized protein n=1 Tax=Microbacterium rhizosphaerae TaxID=1678237 RepID=A0ABZ0SN38_9MICO|nr:hypothetical protein [Microbacterium rhizosphaerae]WPR89691.1 hypothetical protein SM116_18335 [Microbacterium rhizosphaerae]